MRATARLFLAAPGAKAKATTAARKAASAVDDIPARATEILSQMVRPVFAPKPHSDSERARRRRNMIAYGRLKRADHLADERKANKFLTAKWTAIDALPHIRRVEALSGQPRHKPPDAPIWTSTPPIPGFNVGDLTKKS